MEGPRIESGVTYAIGGLAAARMLGMSRSTFLRRCEKWGQPEGIHTKAGRGIVMYPAPRLEEWNARINAAGVK